VPPGYEGRSSVVFSALRGLATVAVSRGPLDDGESLRNHFDRNLVAMAKQREGLSLEVSVPRTVAGMPASELACTWTVGGTTLAQRLVMVAIGDQVVSFAVTADEAHRSELGATLAKLLSGLTVRGGPASGSPPLFGMGVTSAAPTPARPPPTAPSPPPSGSAVAPPSNRRGRSTQLMEALPMGFAPPTPPPPASSVVPVAPRASGFAPSGPTPAETAAASFAAAHWQCESSAVGPARDLGMRVTWAVRHQVVSVRGPDARWIVLATGAGAPLVFDDERRLASLNHMLRVERLRLPSGLEATQLADAFVLFFLGPAAGIVGCPALLESQRPHFARWLAPPYDEAERLFVRHCAAPALNDRDAQWSLDFSVFNARGGIDACRATGDAQHVRTFDRTAVVAEGRLHFPFAA
jgi:hypothetical protein